MRVLVCRIAQHAIATSLQTPNECQQKLGAAGAGAGRLVGQMDGEIFAGALMNNGFTRIMENEQERL